MLTQNSVLYVKLFSFFYPEYDWFIVCHCI